MLTLFNSLVALVECGVGTALQVGLVLARRDCLAVRDPANHPGNPHFMCCIAYTQEAAVCPAPSGSWGYKQKLTSLLTLRE